MKQEVIIYEGDRIFFLIGITSCTNVDYADAKYRCNDGALTCTNRTSKRVQMRLRGAKPVEALCLGFKEVILAL